MPSLTRAWQKLLKGLEETRAAPAPISAAEMVLIRLAYAADLPSPADLIRKLQGASAPAVSAAPATAPAAPPPSGGNGGASAVSQGGSARAEPMPQADLQPQASGRPQPRPFRDHVAPRASELILSVALAVEQKEGVLEAHLIDNVHLVRFQPGRIELRPGNRAPPDLIGKLSQRLHEWTGVRWVVTVSRESGEPTLREQRQAAERQRQDEVNEHPLVKAALRAFPGAQVTSIIDTAAAEAAPMEADAVIDADSDELGELDL